ncbi:hypothetical protein LINPERPRIM_LOCUS11087 [Linum perenne]
MPLVLPSLFRDWMIRLRAYECRHSLLRPRDVRDSELSVTLQGCLLGGTSGAGAEIDMKSLIVAEGRICWDL